jgi:chromosome partitioning protein
MRGRRRGRNRSSPQDPPESTTASGPAPVGTGAVTLIQNPPPVAPPGPSSASAPVTTSAEDTAVSQPSSNSETAPTRRIEETISDVATAHAELDNVLPPSAASPGAPALDVKRTAGPERVGDTPVDPSTPPVVGHKAPVDVTEPVRTPPPAADGSSDAVTEAPVDPEPRQRPPAEPGPADPPVAVQADEPPEADEAADPELEVQAASGNPLPRVLAVANQKGGVGKTTTSVNLGAALAELGFRVLVIDLDPQGNATTGLGIDARNFELSMYDVLMRDSSLEDCVEPTSMKNLFVAPATIALAGAEIELVPAFSRELKLKKSIESVIDEFDYVLIDCPPSLGLITVNALAAADEVLVPIQCEYYALEGLSQLMRNVHLVASNLNPKLDISTIVLTMYDARTKLADQVANEVRLHFGSKVCRNVIPRTVRLSEAPSFGQPITAFDPASRGAIAYRELAKEVSGGTT